MKNIIIFLIRLYQILVSPILVSVFCMRCRYNESCSQYAMRIIKEKGVVKGVPKAALRLLSCQPFAKILHT